MHLNTTNPVVTYTFGVALYVGHDLVDIILNTIEKYIRKSTQLTKNLNLRVPVKYLKDTTLGTHGLNFTILISSTKEIEYARYLLHFWKSVINPFLIENKHVFSTLPGAFNRLFSLTGSSTSWYCGKKDYYVIYGQLLI